MKVLFINDSTSSSNWGDRAAATSLRSMVEARGGRVIFTVAEQDLWDSSFGRPWLPVVGDNDAPPELRDKARRWLPPVALEARRRLRARGSGGGQDQHDLLPASWQEFEPAADAVLRESGHGWPVLLAAMRDADVVVIHGASLHGRGIFPRSILFLAYLAKTRFATPIVLANHTADLEDPLLREIAEHVYPLLDDVVFRDPLSPERVAAIRPGRYAGDTAFWYEPAERAPWAAIARRPGYFDVWPDAAAFDPADPYICVGGSSAFHERRDWKTLTDSYATLVERLRDAYAGGIVLTASAELDEPVFRSLALRLGLPLVGVRTPVRQAVDLVGNAAAYIGGRWHPGIFALRGGAPLIALSSQTFKMSALATAPGASPAPFDALDPGREADAIAARLGEVLAEGEGLRRLIRDWADDLARRSWGNVDYLTDHSQKTGAPGPAG